MIKTFGNMNSVQTRNAIYYIENYDGITSDEIAKILSSYKNSPRVSRKTVSNLRGYLTRHFEYAS